MGNAKTAIVMIHGIAASKETMTDLAEELAPEYRCILLDLPGHNGLEMSDISCFNDLVQYIQNFIFASEDIEQFFVLGYSLGGMIALELGELLEKETKFKGLVIWSAPVLGFEEGLSPVGKATIPIVKRIPVELADNVVTNDKIFKIINRALKKAKIHGQLNKKSFSNININAVVKVIDLSSEYSFCLNTSRPNLFLFDKYDILVDIKNYTLLNEKHNKKNSTVRLINRSGHFKNEKGFAELKEEIKIFLKANI